MATLSQTLSEFIADLSFDKLPGEVVEAVELHILDTIGAGLYGTSLEEGQLMLNFVISQAGKGEATMLPGLSKVPLPHALMANSALTHLGEIDDIHNEGAVCIGAVVVPSVLALSEVRRVDGKRFIEAVAAGYEVMARVGMAIGGPNLFRRGLWPSSLCGPFGSATAATKLLELDVSRISHALGIAGLFGGGLATGGNEGPSGRDLILGRAAQNGVLAALAAEAGFTGPSRIFEDPRGFCFNFSSSPQAERLTEGLGSDFQITRTGIKPYSCARQIHSAIDGLLKIISERDLSASDISEIVVKLPGQSLYIVDKPEPPRNRKMALSSAQFILAVAAREGEVFTDQFSQSRWQDPGLLSLMKRVKIESSSRLDAVYPKSWPAHVSIKSFSGAWYECEIMAPRGDPANPLTRQEVEGKFFKLAEPVMGRDGAEAIRSSVERLEGFEDASRLLGFGPTG